MISMPVELEARIREEGEKAYPEECCGFIMGRDEGGSRFGENIMALENAREGNARRRRFRIAADEFIRAEREASAQGRDIIGIYHSHPDHPAFPSEYDRENSLPFYSYIILSVVEGRSGECKSYLLETDRSSFREEAITLSRDLN
ncbi:MAG: M67 family metallopeptidase [Planctomycetota bacterium]|jgi:proteasome lid subunit RPN8/RPN11|nr:M67 family metallopeptidase [Planctomycetota bacterium]